MSGVTARVSRRVEATLRRVQFAEEDLTALFDQRMLKRGRSLVLASAVSLTMTTPGIAAIVVDGGAGYRVQLSPTQRGHQILVAGKCSCGAAVCTHQAATALAVLDREPGWRRPVQPSLFEILPGTPCPSPGRSVASCSKSNRGARTTRSMSPSISRPSSAVSPRSSNARPLRDWS